VIVLDVAQGSPEWHRCRLGRPTASNFHKILTPKTLKIAAGRFDYMHELLAEWMLGAPLEEFTTAAMEYGKFMEPVAVAWYEFQHDVKADAVGFVLRDDERVGCSPDRFIGSDGILEVKCRQAKAHVACLLGDEIASPTQVQGNLWVTEREWADVLGYHERMPAALCRVGRDEKFIKALSDAVEQFCDELAEARLKITALGAVGRTDSLESLLTASLELVK
jgi:hypothetical protein